MTRLRWIAWMAGLGALVTASVLYAQGGGGGMRGGQGAGAGMGPGMMDPQRMQAMIERLGLNEAEQSAVRKAIEAKAKARTGRARKKKR